MLSKGVGKSRKKKQSNVREMLGKENLMSLDETWSSKTRPRQSSYWVFYSRNRTSHLYQSLKMEKLDGPTVSMNPLTDSSGTGCVFPSKSWSMKMTTIVISSWYCLLNSASTFLSSSYFTLHFLAASVRHTFRSLFAIP